jgi:hypothetical protein
MFSLLPPCVREARPASGHAAKIEPRFGHVNGKLKNHRPIFTLAAGRRFA